MTCLPIQSISDALPLFFKTGNSLQNKQSYWIFSICGFPMSGVEMLDGAGLGMLVFLHCWTRGNGIQLTLVNPSNLAREMLELARLTCVLPISSVDDAVEVLCNSNSTTENENRAVA